MRPEVKMTVDVQQPLLGGGYTASRRYEFTDEVQGQGYADRNVEWGNQVTVTRVSPPEAVGATASPYVSWVASVYRDHAKMVRLALAQGLDLSLIADTWDESADAIERTA